MCDWIFALFPEIACTKYWLQIWQRSRKNGKMIHHVTHFRLLWTRFLYAVLPCKYIQHIQSRILWNALMKILFIAIQNQLSRFFSSSNIMSFCIKRKGREFFITSEICKRSKHFFEGHAVRDQIDNYKYVKLMSFWLSFQRSQFFDVQR